MHINNYAVLNGQLLKTFMGSRGGEERLIRILTKDLLIFDPVEVCELVLRYAPNNCRWRRFATKARKTIKSRAKTALEVKAELMQFVQAK